MAEANNGEKGRSTRPWRRGNSNEKGSIAYGQCELLFGHDKEALERKYTGKKKSHSRNGAGFIM